MNPKPTQPEPFKPSTDHARPTRTVLLRHTEADGGSHLDWMIDPGGDKERRLVTFRVRDRIDLQGCQGFDAERIGDHRAVYLEYEGELSGGRGAVARVAAGEIRAFSDAAALNAVANFGSGWRKFSGRPVEGARWLFSVLPC